jgi:hypothetical protein
LGGEITTALAITACKRQAKRENLWGVCPAPARGPLPAIARKISMKLNKKILIIFTQLLISCLKQSGDKEANNSQKNDTVIKIINFEKSKAVIFPGNYWKKSKYANSEFANEHIFFTPDEETIRNIETQLPEAESLIYAMWQSDSNVKAKDMNLYDKQYYGYVDDKKDSIVAVRVFNLLNTYPHSAKKQFDTEVNTMVCGWYNFNTVDFSYSLKNKNFKDFK